MATSRLCSIPNTRKRTAAGEVQRYFREVVLTYSGTNCLIWPYGKFSNGYGQIALSRHKKALVHRRVCEIIHGPAPTPRHEAAHECGKAACCNPNHLRWATKLENHADRIAHGTTMRGEKQIFARLTESDVKRIRELRGVVTQRELSKAFNVSQTTINYAQSGRNWGWL